MVVKVIPKSKYERSTQLCSFIMMTEHAKIYVEELETKKLKSSLETTFNKLFYFHHFLKYCPAEIIDTSLSR